MDELTQNSVMLSLLQKYLENKCTEQELHILLNWLKTPESSNEVDSAGKLLWNQLDSRIPYPDEKRITELNHEVDIILQKIHKNTPVPTPKKNLSRRNWIYRIAGVFLIMLSVSIGYRLLHNPTQEQISYKEIYADRGEMKEYTLDDGTHITLNSESKIRIPSDYNDQTRQIEMEGEGFFDVTANPKKPFVIKNDRNLIKVLGTSFNVKAYQEDDFINVTVSTGKVLVNVPDQDLQLRVTPLEHLSINKKTGNLTKLLFEENKYTNWIEGTLFFHREPIREVIKTINRKYNKNVLLQCRNCEHIISGTHDNKSIEAVVEAICFTTGLKYREEGDNIILYE